MLTWLQANWFMYFTSGMITLVVSWTMTGCRFGNRVEEAQSADQVTGYYETQVYSVRVCTSLGGCADVPTESQPYIYLQNGDPIADFVAYGMTNPLGFQLMKPETGDAFFVPTDGSGASELPTKILADQSLEGEWWTDPFTLWHNAACTSTFHAEQTGKLIKGESKPIAGTQYSTRGRIEAHFIVTIPFMGDCAASLIAIRDCYLDFNDCGKPTAEENEEFQQYIVDAFKPYIVAGLIQPTDIPSLTGLIYEVSYR